MGCSKNWLKGALLTAAAAFACDSLSTAGKNACNGPSDCIEGFSCRDGMCTSSAENRRDAGEGETGLSGAGPNGGGGMASGAGGALGSAGGESAGGGGGSTSTDGDAGGGSGGAGGSRDAGSAGGNAAGGSSGGSVTRDSGYGDGGDADSGYGDGGDADGGDGAVPQCDRVHVSATSNGTSQDGKEWATAYRDLAAAMQNAKATMRARRCASIEVWVAEGTYAPGREGARDASFVLSDGLELYGGFAGTETTRDARDLASHASVLSADLLGDDATSTGFADNAYHVVTGELIGSRAVLDGFTIERGRADGSVPNNDGAGIYLKNGSPTLSNLVIRNNVANQDGGSVYLENSSPLFTHVSISGRATRGGGIFAYLGAPKLRDVTFQGCNATDWGGGIYADHSDVDVADSQFKYDEAYGGHGDGRGGGVVVIGGRPIFRATRFEGNTVIAQGNGSPAGAAVFSSNSSPRIEDCIFTGNHIYAGSGEHGAGVAIYSVASSNVHVLRTIFDNNASSGDATGGAIASESSILTLANVKVSSNGVASGDGGGVFVSGGSASMVNLYFYNNAASRQGGALYVAQSDVTVVNATFSQNYISSCAPPYGNCGSGQNYYYFGTAVYGPAKLVNSVVWAISGPPLSQPPSLAEVSSVTYSCITDGTYDETIPSETNRDDCASDPPPAVDHGSTSALPADIDDLDGDGNVTEPIPLDFDGKRRVVGASVDMGCIEAQ